MSPLLKRTSFDSSKCVSLLEVTIQRIKILRNKRSIIVKQSREDVAKLLQKGQDVHAAARVEHAFREANIAGAYDLLEQYCQLIIKHIRVIKSEKECPPDLKEAIASVIYAAPRCGDLQELQKLRDILTLKCGSESSAVALEQRPEGSVDEKIIQKLSSRPPNSDTRLNLLKEIAQEYKITWDYQKAVAAILKDGETPTQDKPVSKSPSQVSKGAVSTDTDKGNAKLHASASMHQEKASTSAHTATPSKSINANSEPRDFVRVNQASADVARQPPVANIHKPPFDSHRRDGKHKSHASTAGQNTSPSTTHRSSPKPRDFVGARPPTIVDKGTPKHHISSKEKDNVPAHADATPSTMHRAIPRQKEFMVADHMSDTGLNASANKAKLSAMYAHPHELKGQPSVVNHSRNHNSLYEEKGFARPSHEGALKEASVVTLPDGFMERAATPAHLTADEKMSRPKAFAESIQVPDVSKPKSPARSPSELDRPMVQPRSAQGIFQARIFSPKQVPSSISHHETNHGDVEFLAAKHYRKAHESYTKVDTDGERADRTSMDISGYNMKAEPGTHSPHVDPGVRPRQGILDYKKVSNSYKRVEEPKRTPQARDGEEDTSAYEYYAREQPKGTQYLARERHKGAHYQGASNASIHEGIWGSRNAVGSQDRHQAEENHHRDSSTLHSLSKGHVARASAHSELNDDIADLEAAAESACLSAAHAADAAKAAIDMVRTSPTRSRADRKVGDVQASRREPYPRTSSNQINILPLAHAEMLSLDTEVQVAPSVEKNTALVSHETVLCNKSIRKKEEPLNHRGRKNEPEKKENDKIYTEAYQEQEPEFLDTKMPHFDDYSSYESSEDEAPFYRKGRAGTVRKDAAHENKKAAPNECGPSTSPYVEQGQGNFANESAHAAIKKHSHESVHASVKKHSHQDSSGSLDYDDCAESEEFFSPKSPSSLNQHSTFSNVHHGHQPQFDEYEQLDNEPAWNSATPIRSHVIGVNTRNANGGMASLHGEQQGHSTFRGSVDNGTLRWKASVHDEEPTRDVSRQRWNLRAPEEEVNNTKQSLQPHIRAHQHDYPSAIGTQDSHQATRKYIGISQRSVRSSKG